MALKINKIAIGEGAPKICVPIVGSTIAQCVRQAIEIKSCEDYSRIDIVEFRGDSLVQMEDEIDDIINVEEKTIKALLSIKEILNDKIILYTYRSAFEGGTKYIINEYSKDDIVRLDKRIIDTKLIDIIDVELFLEHPYVNDIVEYAHNNNVRVIMSNHDFNKTPTHEEIVERLCRMDRLGADIVKLAAMPISPFDVAILLGATSTAKELIEKPIVTMSMGKIGSVSRFAGEYFGSDITFGAVKKISAPGQINIHELVQILDIISNLL